MAVDLEQVAQVLHEAGKPAARAAAAMSQTPDPAAVDGWDQLSEWVKEGRREQARRLLAVYYLTPIVEGNLPAEPEPALEHSGV